MPGTIALIFALLAPAPGPPDPDPNRSTIESIAVQASGDEGVVRTKPLYMQGKAGAFHFGGKACRRVKPSAAVLEQLHKAMLIRQPVAIEGDTTGSGDAAVTCLRTVTFYPREP